MLVNSQVAIISGSSKYTWRTKYHCLSVQRCDFHSRALYCHRIVFRNFVDNVPFQDMHFSPLCTMYVWEPVRRTVVLVKGGSRNFSCEHFYTRVRYCAMSSLILTAQCLLFSLWLGLTCSCLFKLFHGKINSQWFFPRHASHTAGQISSPGFCQ